MTASNIVIFPPRPGELPPDRLQEIRDAGFTHYRRVSDDPDGKLAAVWTTLLILCDVAEAGPDPMAVLDGFLGDMRQEAVALLDLASPRQPAAPSPQI